MKKEIVALVLEALGVTSAVGAGFTVNNTAGLSVLAVGAVLFGIAIERS